MHQEKLSKIEKITDTLEKILANHISGKALVPEYVKNSYNSKKKKKG